MASRLSASVSYELWSLCFCVSCVADGRVWGGWCFWKRQDQMLKVTTVCNIPYIQAWGVTECMQWNCVIGTQKKGNGIFVKLQKKGVTRLQIHEIIYRMSSVTVPKCVLEDDTLVKIIFKNNLVHMYFLAYVLHWSNPESNRKSTSYITLKDRFFNLKKLNKQSLFVFMTE